MDAADRAASLPPRRLSSPMKPRIQSRPRLNEYYTLDDAVSLFKSRKNLIVLTGAGISTSLGVPDFRSVNGVYSLLEDSIYADPQEFFHIENFKTDPEEFFKQAAKVFPKMQGLSSTPSADRVGEGTARVPSVPKFSLTHAFIAMLQAKGRLLTNYTQNIDGLEVVAGIQASKLIQCHGTLATATCMSCGKRISARKYMPVVQAGGVPYCKCSLLENPPLDSKQQGKRGRPGNKKKKKRKRNEFEDSDSDSSQLRGGGFPKGLLKPDMTFFGEDIADTYAPRLQIDISKVDLLVIIGTSLKVEPVNEMLLNIPASVPQIWISKDRCQREGVKVDVELLGECDLILEEIARRAGWQDALLERSWETRRNHNAEARSANSAAPAPRPLGEDRKSSIPRPNGLISPVEKQTVIKKEDIGLPPPPPKISKTGRPLQIRQKSNESTNSPVSASFPRNTATSEILIQINGPEVLPPLPAEDERRRSTEDISSKSGMNDSVVPKITSAQPLAPVATSEERPKDSKLTNGPGHVGKKAPTTNATPSPPSKVVVELEEGTVNRWYIKRRAR